MSFLERLFHALLFEMLAVLFSVLGLKFLTEHEMHQTMPLLIVISFVAVGWNFIFNWIFDRYVTGKRIQRSLLLRVGHSLTFEMGLLLFTLPLMMYWLEIDFLSAFTLDVGITLFILVYTFVFNLCYDHIRAFWFE